MDGSLARCLQRPGVQWPAAYRELKSPDGASWRRRPLSAWSEGDPLQWRRTQIVLKIVEYDNMLFFEKKLADFSFNIFQFMKKFTQLADSNR